MTEIHAIVSALGHRSLVLVGMMGAGKSAVGKKLATSLGISFIDSDSEIKRECGMPISDYFAKHGEADFRRGESRIVAKLLENGPQVLATGGGAFCDAQTRALVPRKGISIWLKAHPDTLIARVAGRSDRPILNAGNPSEALRRLLSEREAFYSQADLTIDVENRQRKVVEAILDQAATIVRVLNSR